jgi:hypothetical protein
MMILGLVCTILLVCASRTHRYGKRFFRAEFSIRAYQGTDNNFEPTGERTREEVGQVLDRTWNEIDRLIPALALEKCREELKGATALLVLATLRRSADSDDTNKKIVNEMFKAADADGDGDLTFMEWFEWLNGTDRTNKTPSPSQNEGEPVLFGPILPPDKTSNPIIQSINQVFSHALFSLQVLSRVFHENPSEYVSAFIAGGMMSGVLDREICRNMLQRLSPETRELISFSLSIESASLPTVLKKESKEFLIGSVKELADSSEGFVEEEKEDISAGNNNIIETIDLASIPLLEAPSIFDDPVPIVSGMSSPPPTSSSPLVMVPARGETATSRSLSTRVSSKDIDILFERAQSLSQEITQLRSIIRDLDDKQANSMRLLVLRDYGDRGDILRLAMTIRATRLQHSSNLPVHARHQLAIDTLQVWAPLSFQLDMSASIAELEVHSYVLLFPRSFGTFIDWYGAYRPLAEKMIEIFKRDLLNVLRNSSEVSGVIKKVTLQSRLKTPSSAFKKMVKGAKRHHQLLDLAGVRLIVEECGDDKEAEIKAVRLAYSLLTNSLNDWKEETSRFKDYVTNPKPSGYQSIHLSLRHLTQGLNLEVQIRSAHMHAFAENGPAAHKSYKALLLPSATDEKNKPKEPST